MVMAMKKIFFIFLILLFIVPFRTVFALNASDVPYGSTVYVNGISGKNSLFTDQSCTNEYNVENESIYCLMSNKSSPSSSYTFTKKSLDEAKDDNGNYVINKGTDTYTFTYEQKLKLLALLMDPAFDSISNITGSNRQYLVWYILGQKSYDDLNAIQKDMDEVLNSLSDEYLRKTYYKYDFNYYSTESTNIQDVIGSPVLYPSISFEKVDEKGNALSGVEFTVYELKGEIPKNNGVIDKDATKAAIQAGSVTLEPTNVHIEKKINDSTYEYIGENNKWTSTDDILSIYFTYLNGNFMIRETKGLSGYSGSDDVFLSINNRKVTANDDNSIRIVNNKIYAAFQLEDEGGNTLGGATFQVKKIRVDEFNNIVTDDGVCKFKDTETISDWTTDTSKPHSLNLSDGLYELSETVTPSGYIPSAPMYFYIADDGTVSSVTISDDCSYKIGDKIGDGTNYSEDKVDAIVLMVNRKKVNSAVEDNIKESPNTGGIHVVVALVLLGISLATIFVAMSFGRKIEKI